MLRRTRNASMLLAGALALGSWAGADDDDQAAKKKKKAGAWQSAPLTEPQRQEIAGLFEGLVEVRRAVPVSDSRKATEPCCEAGAPCEACETYSSNTKSLVTWLTKSPEAWEVLTPILTDAFVAEDTTPVQRDTMLGLLGWTKSKYAVEVGDALWERGARHFTEDHVLAFAENGNDILLAECEKLAAKAGRKGGGIRPAALVVLRAGYGKYGAWGKKAKGAGYGEPAGGGYVAGGAVEEEGAAKGQDEKLLAKLGKTLTAAIEVQVDAGNAPDVLLAALALDRIGDAKAWSRARERVHSAVLAALDGGQIERARAMALQAEFFDMASSSGEPVQVSYMDERLRVHLGQRSKEVATADQVFDLIERITPL